MKPLAVGVVVAVALVSGCGAKNPSPVSAKAAKALRPFVQELRLAAAGTSIAAVQEKEHALVNEVQDLESNGELNPKRAQNIDNAAVRLLSDFKHHNEPTPSPTITPSPSPTVTESPSATPTPTITVTIPPIITPSATPSATPTETPMAKQTRSQGPLLGR